MPNPRVVSKSNPEIENINPESFELEKENKETIKSPERPDFSPDRKLEQASEKKELDKIEEKFKDLPPEDSTSSQALSFHNRREKEIDNILSSGLHDIFLKMNPKKQQEFKLAGEETSKKINLLLDKSKVNISKIVKLIRKWLKMIPGVNEFFLEKEAKIKADQIINIKDKV